MLRWGLVRAREQQHPTTKYIDVSSYLHASPVPPNAAPHSPYPAAIVLMRSELSGICLAFDISRATLKRIKLNLGLSLVYNTIGIPAGESVVALRTHFARQAYSTTHF